MQRRAVSYNAVGRLLGIGRSTAHAMLHYGYWPTRVPREQLTKKIKSAIAELKKSILITTRDEVVREVDIMENVGIGAQRRFGLRWDPFLNEIHGVSDIYPMKEAEDALEYMKRIALFQGFGALVGEVGTGKTLLLRKLEEQLASDHVRFVQVRNTDKVNLKPRHILETIVFDLTGTPHGGGKSMEQMSRIVRGLLADAEKEDQRVCLVIDDAQQIPRVTLRSLKQLYDLDKGFRRSLGILLLGQLELLEAMRDPRLRETTNRCGYMLMQGLAQPKTFEGYLKFKLERAGGDFEKIVDPGCMKEIRMHATVSWDWCGERYQMAPELRVQNLMARLLNTADRLGEARITREIVDVALGQK
jgi:MSHA biogenesis protein MshM